MAHIYHSALPFAPRSSLLKKKHADDFACEAKVITGIQTYWCGPLRTIMMQNGAETIKYSNDGGTLAVGGFWFTSVYDSQTGERTMALLTNESNPEIDYVTAVAFSPDSKVLAGAGDSDWTHTDRTLILWDLRTGTLKTSFELGISSMDASLVMSFHSNSEQLLTLAIPHKNQNRTELRVWNITTGHCERAWSFPSDLSHGNGWINRAYITRADLLPLLVLRNTNSRCAEFWELDPPRQLGCISGTGAPPAGRVAGVCAIGDLRCSIGSTGFLTFYDNDATDRSSPSEVSGWQSLLYVNENSEMTSLPTSKTRQTMKEPRIPVTEVAISPNGRFVAFAGVRERQEDDSPCGMISIWDTKTSAHSDGVISNDTDWDIGHFDFNVFSMVAHCQSSSYGELLAAVLYSGPYNSPTRISIRAINQTGTWTVPKIIHLSEHTPQAGLNGIWHCPTAIIFADSASLVTLDSSHNVIVWSLHSQTPSQKLVAGQQVLSASVQPSTSTARVTVLRANGCKLGTLEDRLYCVRWTNEAIECWAMIAAANPTSGDAHFVLTAEGHLPPLHDQEIIESVDLAKVKVRSNNTEYVVYITYRFPGRIKDDSSRRSTLNERYFGASWTGDTDNTEQLCFGPPSGYHSESINNQQVQLEWQYLLECYAKLREPLTVPREKVVEHPIASAKEWYGHAEMPAGNEMMIYWKVPAGEEWTRHREEQWRKTPSEKWAIGPKNQSEGHGNNILWIPPAYEDTETGGYWVADKLVMDSPHPGKAPGHRSMTVVDFSLPNSLDPMQPF